MKYMGSKQSMLRSGLGLLLETLAEDSKRVVDLFAGTAAISWYIAERVPVPVLAVDLQEYSRVLANSVLLRTKELNTSTLEDDWVRPATEIMKDSEVWKLACDFKSDDYSQQDVETARCLCKTPCDVGPAWSAYGGYYFSPSQALMLDCLRATLPKNDPKRSVCLAALIITASKCAASPGHTAQPFSPTPTATPYISDSWRKEPLVILRRVLPAIGRRCARIEGRGLVGNARKVAATLEEGDLAIIDPPYSTAQYSRFYHVLESIARGNCGPVAGAGRYPPIKERPQSDFSKKTTVRTAMVDLLESLSRRGSTAIMTFPQHGATNGLEGEVLLELAARWFQVDVSLINTRFSTLGGNGAKRSSRRNGREMMVLLSPRP